ncbi:hypothetical protein V1264_016262 [Littorina saxatilis]|uniref:Uncharacterized protein n=1 Tax=Littorina saxatilis TaxID=31220 RepID=A0AAN9GIZ8_9CAEN
MVSVQKLQEGTKFKYLENLDEEIDSLTAQSSSYVCSDIYYLQTAYYPYTQEYGRLNIDQNGKYTHVAYP